MRLSITTLCLLLLSLKQLTLAEDDNTDLIVNPERASNTESKNVATLKPVKKPSNEDDDDNKDDDENDNEEVIEEEEGEEVIEEEEDDDDEKVNSVPVVEGGKGVIPHNDGSGTEYGADIGGKTIPKTMPPIETALETPEASVDEDGANGETFTQNLNDSTHAFIETSKDVTAQLYNAISGIATTNITMDAWKNQSWANKTPREVVDMIEDEVYIMFHDKYVHLIIVVMSILSIMLALYVAKQILEYPKGATAKFCQCTIACLRIICCPIYTILCCPCCTSKKNRPNTKEYSNLPLHDVNDSKMN